MAANKPTESPSAGNQHQASFQSTTLISSRGCWIARADCFSLVGPVDSEEGPSEQQVSAPGQSANPEDGAHEHAVRFNSVLQEIEPEHSLNTVATLSQEGSKPEEPLSPEAQEEIRSLSQSLQQTHLQHRRMSNFAFEPVSLPVSRVRHCRYGWPLVACCQLEIRDVITFTFCDMLLWRTKITRSDPRYHLR